MAYKMTFSSPYNGMPFIWNISDQVGDRTSCRNNPTDVDLVALLLGAFLISVVNKDLVHPDCQQNFLINGKMDPNIAYWIRAANSERSERFSFGEEGIISRARGRYYSDGTWTIVKLNQTMRAHMKWGWENLPGNPLCPPALATELLNKTSP
jgi:hypothetical protein